MSLIKQQWGDFLAIGGSPSDLIPLALSLHNWGAITLTPKDNDDYYPLTDTEPYLSLGNPDEFVYFLVKEDNYLKARANAFVTNLDFKYKGRNGKLTWGICCKKAKLELISIRDEQFL